MLPAPRDPHSPEAVPPDPPPAPPPDPPPLAHQLTGLLRSAGAQAAHAVDGGRCAVLAEVGLADGDDVPALVQLVRAAKALGRGRGEWLEDLVVTLGRTVHVLRECDGVVLHARLDPARGDVGAVRRGLASGGLLEAAEAAGRAAAEAAGRAAAERAGDGAGDPGVRLGRPGPVPGSSARPADEPADPHPPAAAPSAEPGPGRPRPEAGASWPYSLPAPPPAAAPSPSRRVTHPAGPPPAAPRPAPPRPAAPAEPAATASPTAPAMQRVAPPPRQAPPRPLASMPGPSRPRPVSRPVSRPNSRPTSRPTPQLTPQLTPQPTPRPTPRPSPLPRPERLQEPPPVPLPRPAGGPGPVGRDPALVTVDGGPQFAGSGALAVLALPPVAALPRRRRAAAAPPVRSPRGMVTPPVLRQPWASDVPTMRRLVAGLHRLN